MPTDMDDKPSVWLKEIAVDVAVAVIATAVVFAVLFGLAIYSFHAQENVNRGSFSEAASPE